MNIPLSTTFIGRSVLPLFLSLIIVSSGVKGQSRPPLITDRPNFTESATTVPTSLSQIELGYTFSRSGGERTHSLGEVLLRTGISRTVELRLGLNSFVVSASNDEQVSGFEDVVVGAKISVLGVHADHEKSGPLIAAFLLSGSIPTGARAFSDGSVIPRGTLAAEYAVSEVFSVSSNVSYSLMRSSGRSISQFSFSLSLGLGISDRLGGFAEVYRLTSPDAGGATQTFLDTGVMYLITADVQIDGRIGSSMNGADPGYFAGLGAAFRFAMF